MADRFNPLQQQALQQALRRQQVRPAPRVPAMAHTEALPGQAPETIQMQGVAMPPPRAPRSTPPGRLHNPSPIALSSAGELRGDVPGRTSRPAQQPALSPAEIDAGQQIPSASAPPRVRAPLQMPPMQVQGRPPQVQVTPGQLQRVPLEMDPLEVHPRQVQVTAGEPELAMDPVQVAGLPPRP